MFRKVINLMYLFNELKNNENNKINEFSHLQNIINDVPHSEDFGVEIISNVQNTSHNDDFGEIHDCNETFQNVPINDSLGK